MIDWGVDKIGWGINLKKELTKLAEWMNTQTFISDFVKA